MQPRDSEAGYHTSMAPFFNSQDLQRCSERGKGKNFNVHSNIVTVGRESEKTWAAYLHFLQQYRSRQVSSEWNMIFSKIISRKIFPQKKRNKQQHRICAVAV